MSLVKFYDCVQCLWRKGCVKCLSCLPFSVPSEQIWLDVQIRHRVLHGHKTTDSSLLAVTKLRLLKSLIWTHFSSCACDLLSLLGNVSNSFMSWIWKLWPFMFTPMCQYFSQAPSTVIAAHEVFLDTSQNGLAHSGLKYFFCSSCETDTNAFYLQIYLQVIPTRFRGFKAGRAAQELCLYDEDRCWNCRTFALWDRPFAEHTGNMLFW